MASLVCWAMAFEKLIRVWLLNREIRTLETSSKTGTLPAGEIERPRPRRERRRAHRMDGRRAGRLQRRGARPSRTCHARRHEASAEEHRTGPAVSGDARIGRAVHRIVRHGLGHHEFVHRDRAAKDTSLAVVAPGIAEALFATAVGLAAAIPAVIFYNQITVALGRASDRVAPAIVGLARSLSRSGIEGMN